MNTDSSAYSGSIDERPKAQIAMHNISGKPITSNRPIVGSMKIIPRQVISYELMPDTIKCLTPETILT